MFFGLFTDPLQTVIRIFCVLLCLTIHEVAHGFAALKLGDATAKNMGRLTLNPIPHIDPIGGLLMLLGGFGWAKPVPIDPRNFTRKVTMRAGMAITAFAGPLSNLLFAFIVMLTHAILWNSGVLFGMSDAVLDTYLTFYFTLAGLNIGLAIFNLIPLPPLDGSWILSSILPHKLHNQYMRIQRFGFLILILLVMSPIGRFLGFLVNHVWNFYEWIIGLLPFV